MPTNLLRHLPSISELLEYPRLRQLREKVSHSVVVSRARSMLEDVRQEVRDAAADIHLPSPAELAERIARRVLQSDEPRLRPVINATGNLLHAGLGRAPLAEDALGELAAVARNYSSVEYDLSSGEPAPRGLAVEGLLRELTGAEAALVVGNLAAAAWLALAAVAAGREVIVSRGELIEDEDGCRLADLAAAAGARLREVGATNGTRPDDYRQAIGETTAALLLVHPGNYAVTGATGRVTLADLARLSREHRLPLIHHVGGAALVDFTPWGCPAEPLARDSIQQGADLALFSGDQLIGGPPCAVLVGRREWIDRAASLPVAAAFRADKLTLAALAATLRLYRSAEAAAREVPLLALLATSEANLRQRAERLAPQMAACHAIAAAEALADTAELGAGPGAARSIPTWCIALRPREGTADRLAAALRRGAPAVVGRVRDGALLLDLRTVMPRQDIDLAAAVAALGDKPTEAPSESKLPPDEPPPGGRA
jgi:L-seryl-tRNA(Ser) seleniumtransferase